MRTIALSVFACGVRGLHQPLAFNSPLTETVAFYGGSCVTLPDCGGDATYVVRRLAEAIFLIDESFSSPGFVDEVRSLCVVILALGNEVVREAGSSSTRTKFLE